MLVPTEGLVTKNNHVKYQRFSAHCLKVISKVQVFRDRSNSKVKVTEKMLVLYLRKDYSSKISNL